jgi:hypothetical protein
MSTQTRPRNRSTASRSTASTRRFARAGASSQGRRSTGTGGRRTASTGGRTRTINVIRRKPPKSNKDKALGAVMGLMGGKKTASSGGKGAKAGAGMAVLTAAAGLAFKNRDKLTSKLKRNGGGQETDASRPPAGTTGAQVHPMTTSTATDSGVTGRTGTGTAHDTNASSSLGGAGTSSMGAAGTSSSLGAADTTSSLGTDATSLDRTDTMSSVEPADASSSVDPPHTELGGGAGSGTADPLAERSQSDVPFVSPEKPSDTDEPRERS